MNEEKTKSKWDKSGLKWVNKGGGRRKQISNREKTFTHFAVSADLKPFSQSTSQILLASKIPHSSEIT